MVQYFEIIVEIDIVCYCCDISAHGICSPKKASVEADKIGSSTGAEGISKGATQGASPWVADKLTCNDIRTSREVPRWAAPRA
jgi:hypothetical protein